MHLRKLLLLAALGAGLAGCSSNDPYTGRPIVHNGKVYVRRVPPTPEELAATPAPMYESILRAEDAERERLAVGRNEHEQTLYLSRGAAAWRKAIGKRHDPWETYEADRRRVLVRDWADTGKSAPYEPEVKKERPIENDPFAPVPKVTKKAEEPADGEKKPDEAGGEKKPDEGESKPADK